jgi:hypothetical protein
MSILFSRRKTCNYAFKEDRFQINIKELKIYLSCFQSLKDHPIPAYKFWEYYFKKGIEEAAFSWVESEVDWAEALVYSNDKVNLEAWKARTWEKVLADIKKLHANNELDVFISYLYAQQIDLQAIKEIQKLGIPCVNFFCDNVREFTRVPSEFRVFDLNWVPEYKALTMYKKPGFKHIHLPMPMWVEPSLRNSVSTDNGVVSFIGSRDIQRWMLFEKVIEKGLSLEICGAGWLSETRYEEMESTKNSIFNKVDNQLQFLRNHGLVSWYRKIKQRNLKLVYSDNLASRLTHKPSFEEYIEITKNSMVTLGVNRYPSFRQPLYQPDTYSRLRDIEAPMLGACYLTEYTSGLENLYDIGNEIEVYSSADELVEKAKMLKENPKKRIELKISGQKRALNSHGVSASLQAIKKTLGL